MSREEEEEPEEEKKDEEDYIAAPVASFSCKGTPAPASSSKEAKRLKKTRRKKLQVHTSTSLSMYSYVYQELLSGVGWVIQHAHAHVARTRHVCRRRELPGVKVRSIRTTTRTQRDAPREEPPPTATSQTRTSS